MGLDQKQRALRFASHNCAAHIFVLGRVRVAETMLTHDRTD